MLTLKESVLARFFKVSQPFSSCGSTGGLTPATILGAQSQLIPAIG
ncbi:hypothetical protein DFR65_1072 [Oceanihabitans sediminis]|nr:hypothetical protein [Oceanihabitans sediminis]RBP28386.1 hypothetical protein DFR65_1072 [Oceanihabitans sediminis]